MHSAVVVICADLSTGCVGPIAVRAGATISTRTKRIATRATRPRVAHAPTVAAGRFVPSALTGLRSCHRTCLICAVCSCFRSARHVLRLFVEIQVQCSHCPVPELVLRHELQEWLRARAALCHCCRHERGHRLVLWWPLLQRGGAFVCQCHQPGTTAIMGS